MFNNNNNPMMGNSPMMGGMGNYNMPMYNPPFRTNKVFVSSLQDAMSRPSEPNSEVVYIHQDLPMLIQITTDVQGRKTSMVFDLTTHKEEVKADAAYVTADQVVDIVKRQIEALKNEEIE